LTETNAATLRETAYCNKSADAVFAVLAKTASETFDGIFVEKIL
jgi:hypothetical protein